jgi:hypothetical protein
MGPEAQRALTAASPVLPSEGSRPALVTRGLAPRQRRLQGSLTTVILPAKPASLCLRPAHWRTQLVPPLIHDGRVNVSSGTSVGRA